MAEAGSEIDAHANTHAGFTAGLAADSTTLATRIDALLPQTQCTQCGYDGCLPYAQAIAHSGAPINRCPPGGQAGVAALADLLGQPEVALDRSCGEPGPLHLAVIEEEHCIGCTLCIQACPVDAIVGANKRMHTVLADWCTGCGLCVAPCPVDCIVMQPVTPARDWTRRDAEAARQRHHARAARIAQATHGQARGLPMHSASAATRTTTHTTTHTTTRTATLPAPSPALDARNAASNAAPDTARAKHAVIAAALARARARRLQANRPP